MSWVAVAIGAGAGLVKSEAIDAPKAERQRTLAAATQRYSPWTGLKADPVQEADPMGSMLQYGATGASIGQGLKSADADTALKNAQTDWLKRNPYNYGTASSAAMGGAGGAASSPSSPWSLGNFKY